MPTATIAFGEIALENERKPEPAAFSLCALDDWRNRPRPPERASPIGDTPGGRYFRLASFRLASSSRAVVERSRAARSLLPPAAQAQRSLGSIVAMQYGSDRRPAQPTTRRAGQTCRLSPAPSHSPSHWRPMLPPDAATQAVRLRRCHHPAPRGDSRCSTAGMPPVGLAGGAGVKWHFGLKSAAARCRNLE